MALRRLRYSEIEVQLIADVLSVWQKTCNGTWSCDTFLKSAIIVLSNGHFLNFFCPIGKNKENTYYYLAQKLCFWRGIIFIGVYLSVCVSVCLCVCLCVCVCVNFYIDYLKKFLTDFDETWQDGV